MHTRTFLVAGSPVAERPVGLVPASGDRVIAVDRGGCHALQWGWPVHLLVGDLDSLPEADKKALISAGTPVSVAPRVKDETDLELALVHALADGARAIVICAAFGGRVDHMLGNIFLLAKPEISQVDVSIVDGPHTIRLLRGAGTHRAEASELVLHGAPGDLLSLLAFGGDAVGITTRGLDYPLDDETLFLGQARGISNVFQTEVARVRLREGMLLTVQISGAGEALRDPASPEG